jgi:hypothetical protein
MLRVVSVVTIGATLALTAAANAGTTGPVYDTSVPESQWTATRTAASGQLVVDNHNSWGDSATITWNIYDNQDGTLHYEYNLTGFDGWSVSHFTLDLSNDAVGDDDPLDLGVLTNPKLDGDSLVDNPNNAEVDGKKDQVEFGDFSPVPPPFRDDSSPFIEGAVKFDEGSETSSLVYSFDSNRMPVWGDVIVKGGRDGYLYNLGMMSHATSDDPSDFIARPDTTRSVIPTPMASSMMVGLLALAGFQGLRRRRAAA